jgi:hypothetical protein
VPVPTPVPATGANLISPEVAEPVR